MLLNASSRTRKMRNTACAVLVAASSMASFAQGVPVDDEDLADVWGQAMFDVANRTVGTNDFTRITLNADIKLNANFSNIELGAKSTSTDISISNFNFVSGLNGENYVSIKDPYFEFVYKEVGTTKDIIGMRFGFGEISGNLGVKLNSLLGKVTLADGTGGTNTLTLNSSTTTGTFVDSTGGSVATNLVGQIKATQSTDFFISMLTEAVTYGTGDNESAYAGVSINWTKNIQYMNLTGTVMPNPLPALSVRQGG